MLTQIARKRDEELAKMRQFKLLEATMGVINRILPISAKIVAISIYVCIVYDNIASSILTSWFYYQTLVSKGELLASQIFAALMVRIKTGQRKALINLLDFRHARRSIIHAHGNHSRLSPMYVESTHSIIG